MTQVNPIAFQGTTKDALAVIRNALEKTHLNLIVADPSAGLPSLIAQALDAVVSLERTLAQPQSTAVAPSLSPMQCDAMRWRCLLAEHEGSEDNRMVVLRLNMQNTYTPVSDLAASVKRNLKLVSMPDNQESLEAYLWQQLLTEQNSDQLPGIHCVFVPNAHGGMDVAPNLTEAIDARLVKLGLATQESTGHQMTVDEAYAIFQESDTKAWLGDGHAANVAFQGGFELGLRAAKAGPVQWQPIADENQVPENELFLAKGRVADGNEGDYYEEFCLARSLQEDYGADVKTFDALKPSYVRFRGVSEWARIPEGFKLPPLEGKR